MITLNDIQDLRVIETTDNNIPSFIVTGSIEYIIQSYITSHSYIHKLVTVKQNNQTEYEFVNSDRYKEAVTELINKFNDHCMLEFESSCVKSKLSFEEMHQVIDNALLKLIHSS